MNRRFQVAFSFPFYTDAKFQADPKARLPIAGGDFFGVDRQRRPSRPGGHAAEQGGGWRPAGILLIDDIIGYDIISYYCCGIQRETGFDAIGLLTSAVDGVLTARARAFKLTAPERSAIFRPALFIHLPGRRGRP